jgi:hypothetical protein
MLEADTYTYTIVTIETGINLDMLCDPARDSFLVMVAAQINMFLVFFIKC